ncbi:MAG: tetratricopeptide repeat protein, partial [Myxococcota bacterium]|nr:tetratricopeptide repeat protein [Myxococcota bacterium]
MTMDGGMETMRAGELGQAAGLLLDRSIPAEASEAFEAAAKAALGSPDAGISAWQDAWKQAPGHPDIVDALVGLYEQTGKWNGLLDFLKRGGEAVGEADHKAHVLMTMAQVYDLHLKNDVTVVGLYQSVLKLKENYLPAIDAALAKYEAMGRWPDVVKMLKVKGDAVTDQYEKVDVFLKVAQLYLQRFSNTVEATKAFEAVLEVDPYHAQAIDFLKEMYEKRRDWEKLLSIMAKEAALQAEGPERTDALVRMAELANERLRRPELCVERWEAVLESAPSHATALSQLSNFYERTREWGKLAAILERQLEFTADAGEKMSLLQKLGSLYGEKVGDDNKAVEVWKAVLDIDPEDRRAQDQLKKRYLAMRAFPELEAFYASADKWEELIRILEREAESKDAPVGDRVALQFKIAQLWREKKERIDRATRCYQAVLEIDPQNLEAAEALVPILEESRDATGLASVLEVRLSHLEGPEEGLALRRRIAKLYEDEVGDVQKAFEGFVAAFEMAHDEFQSFDDLERVAAKTQNWDEVVSRYRATLPQLSGGAALELKLRLARVLYEEVGRPEEALAHFDEILQKDAKNPRAVRALEKIYAQMGRCEELLDIYARRLQMASDDDERKDILYNQAALWEEEVRDIPKAIDVYLKIIDLAGDEPRALSALDRIYQQDARYDELADILRRELNAEIHDQSMEVDLKLRLAEVCDAHLGDRQEAIKCYREALILEPENANALTGLEAMLEDPQYRGNAARILAPIYEDCERWEALTVALEILAKTATDESEKYHHLIRIGELSMGRLGVAEKAFSAYSRAFQLFPDEGDTFEKLEQVCAILDVWGELVEILESTARGLSDSASARRLWGLAAKYYDSQLENSEKAIEAYNHVLASDPQDPDAIAALEQIYGRLERWDALVGVLRSKIELSLDASVAESVYRQMALIYEEMLGRPEDAVACLKEILAIDPASDDALRGLDRLLARLERWTDLADNLQQQLALGDSEDIVVPLKLRLAELREKQLDEVEGAVEIYREVLEFEPDNYEAISSLEGIMQRPGLRKNVAVILEPTYRAMGAWEKLVGVYEILVVEEDSPVRKIDRLHQMATLYETAGDEPEKAFHTYGRALAFDPADERTQEEIERLARVLVLYDELAKLYERTVSELDNADLQAQYHMKLARLFEENLQDTPSAISHYNQALAADPMNLEAADALERAYQQTEDYEALATVFQRKVEMIADLREQKRLLMRASQIYEEILEQPQMAIEVYKKVLALDEDDLEAIGHLEVLYLTLERWVDLQSVYNRKVDLLETPEEKRDVLYVLGAMYERELEDTKKAIETYQRIIEFDPEDLQAIQRLDILYSQSGEWHDLLSILDREMTLADDPDEAVSFKYRIGELYVRHLSDVPRAVEYFKDILVMCPDHQPSIEMLEDLIRQNKEPLLAAEVLEPLYRDFGDWRKLTSVLEVRLAHAEEDWVKVDLLHQIAALLESDLHLDAPSEAFNAYARALDADNANERTLTRLEELADVTGRWADLAELLDGQLAKVDDAERGTPLALRAGAIYDEKIGHTEEAIARFRKVLEYDPPNRAALTRLDSLFQSHGRWHELADILSKLALVADDPEQSLELQFRQGAVYQSELGDIPRAVSIYREILAAEPSHERTIATLQLLFDEGILRTEIADILEPLYRIQAEWPSLVSLYKSQLEDLVDPSSRVKLMQNMAELYEDKILDGEEAFAWYCRAFSTDPFDVRSAEEVERLAATTSAWSDLADLYHDLYSRSDDGKIKAIAAERLARVSEEELRDVARAEQAYCAVLEIDPDNLQVLSALDRIYTEHMEWERLVSVLDRLAHVSRDVEDKIAYVHRMGVVYESQLEDFEAARRAFHHVIDDLDPGHGESLEHLEMLYADKEMWPELFAIYERMSQVTTSESVLAELLAKMATLSSECLNDIAKASELWSKVVDIRGEDTQVLEALAELHAKQQNWSELVDILERAVGISEDDATRVRIYSQLGTVWGERLQRDRSALEAWENVLTIEHDNLRALKAIAKIHEGNQDWAQLIETIERIIDVGYRSLEAVELRDFYAKLGGIYSDTMASPIDSIEAWRHAHDIDPSDLRTVAALEKLYESQEMWEEMVELLGRKATLLEHDEQVDTLLTQAKICEDKLEEPLRAKTPYMGILDAAPLHVLAFEKLIEIERQEGSWEEMAEQYFKRLNYVHEVADRVVLYHGLALIYEDHLDQQENAFLVMTRAFEEDYTNDETADHLERLASSTGKWNDLLLSSNQVLQTVQDHRIQVSLCLKIGKWYAEGLGHPDYALAYYQRVLSLDPENVMALKLAAELYRQGKQWPELVEVLKRAIGFEDDFESRKHLLVELGSIYETQLGEPIEARDAYKQALALDPALDPALDALERLYLESQSYRELIPILRKKVDITDDPDVRVGIHMRIGRIFDEQLRDPQSAIDEFRKVLDLEQGNLSALKSLERLYQEHEQWQDLLDILEIELEYAASERERVALLSRIAHMLRQEFVKPDKAAERYEQILSIDSAQVETLVALEEIYRQLGQWNNLIVTFERHIDAIPDRRERAEMYRRVGEVYSHELTDPERAIDAYTAILDINPGDVPALEELSKLQTKREDWPAVHDVLQRLAHTVEDSSHQVDLYFRLGRLNEEQLFDRSAAVEHFRSALDINQGHLPSLGALRRVYLEEGEWVAGSRILEAEQQYTEKARERSKLQFELGKLLSSKLGEEAQGIKWYEEALTSDPDNQAAAEPLVDVYIEAKRYADAEPLLDMMLRLGVKRTPAELLSVHKKLGLVADKLDKLDKAISSYEAAYASDTSNLEIVMSLAEAYFRAKEWEKAFKLYQMVLVHYRDKQGKDEIVEIFYRLGHIKNQVGERRKALNMFDKALELDPNHRATLGEVISIQVEQKNFEQVIHFKKVLLDNASDDEKSALLIEIGDIWQEQLKNSQKGISSYVEAMELRPNDRQILHRLLPLYQNTKQWQKVVEIIQKVADIEEDQDKTGRFYYSMGVIYRDEIKSFEEAVECFNKSLDASLENLKSFEAIDKILTQLRDWKSLERAYRRMLRRISGKGRADLEVNLWHFLGEIYRTRLKQFEPAAEAFKMAAKLEPENAVRHEILAELYAMMPERVADAVAEHQWLIKRNPYKVDSYKALRKLYYDNHMWDKAWCLCSTLTFLKKADAEEQQFFEQYRSRGMVRAHSRLDNERWLKDLFHPDESVFVGKAFEVVTSAVRTLKVLPAKNYGLNKKQKRPVNDTMAFTKTFYYANQVLNIPVVPELYVQDDKPGGLSYAITEPMATVCNASLLSGYSPQDLLFIVGRHLAYYRPEHYIRWLLPTHGELKVLLLATIKLGAPEFSLPE